MSLEYKIIYLFFKKDFTMPEIAHILEIEVVRVHKVIGAEVAQHYLNGDYNKFVSYNNSVSMFRNQHPQIDRFKLPLDHRANKSKKEELLKYKSL